MFSVLLAPYGVFLLEAGTQAVQLYCRVGAASSAGSLPKAIPERLCERLAPLFVAASDAVPLDC